MNLYFRLLLFLFFGVFKKRIAPINHEVSTELRVLPNDLDFNWHMNNGRYLSAMDLARFDFMFKAGFFWTAVKNRWFPVLGAAEMQYWRPLRPFQKFQIVTKLEYWDRKWFVISHRFESKGKLIAHGRVRGLFKGPKGNIPPSELLKVLGAEHLTPNPTKEILTWIENLESPPQVHKVQKSQ